MNGVLTRDKIKKEDTWDLEKMIASDEEFQTLSLEIEQLVQELFLMKGHLLESSKQFATYLKKYELYRRKMGKLYVYANMNCDINTKDGSRQALKMKAEKLLENSSSKLSFLTPEILKGELEEILTFLEEEQLPEYQHHIKELFREKPHILSEREEELIALAQNAFGTGEEAFYNLDNADAKFPTIQGEDGKKVELTSSNYAKFLLSKNQNIRKEAFVSYHTYFKDHKNTFASTLKGTIKENFFSSKVRNFRDPLEESLFSDQIDRKVYENLIEVVHRHLPLLHRYLKIRKQLLQVDELHCYDLYCDLIEEPAKDIPFEEGKRLVFEALKPLGNTYLTDLEQAFQKRWIDKYPSDGKKSGAYKWGCYDSYPYVFLNYDNTMDAVSTMAHELGHAMHSYYSDKTQAYINHDYPIFLAEIASTVNESLLDDYLYRTAKTKQEKILYLSNFLDKVRTTIYRQTMFAEFEWLMHEKEKQNIPLTEEAFSDTYYALNQTYYGSNMISDDLIRYEWARIPHFYSSFYVYQYATGLASALSITSDILGKKEDAIEKYLTFLSSGGMEEPLVTLKKAGVDMTTREPLEKAFLMFAQKLQELEKIIKENK